MLNHEYANTLYVEMLANVSLLISEDGSDSATKELRKNFMDATSQAVESIQDLQVYIENLQEMMRMLRDKNFDELQSSLEEITGPLEEALEIEFLPDDADQDFEEEEA